MDSSKRVFLGQAHPQGRNRRAFQPRKDLCFSRSTSCCFSSPLGPRFFARALDPLLYHYDPPRTLLLAFGQARRSETRMPRTSPLYGDSPFVTNY